MKFFENQNNNKPKLFIFYLIKSSVLLTFFSSIITIIFALTGFSKEVYI